MSRVVYEVAPADEAWVVRMASDSEQELVASKDEALRRARKLARRYAAWAIRVLDAKGELEVEYLSPEVRRDQA